MTDKWYIKAGCEIRGPFSTDKILADAQEGHLDPHMKLSQDQSSWATPEEAGFLTGRVPVGGSAPRPNVDVVRGEVDSTAEVEGNTGGRGRPERHTWLRRPISLHSLLTGMALGAVLGLVSGGWAGFRFGVGLGAELAGDRTRAEVKDSLEKSMAATLAESTFIRVVELDDGLQTSYFMVLMGTLVCNVNYSGRYTVSYVDQESSRVVHTESYYTTRNKHGVDLIRVTAPKILSKPVTLRISKTQ